MILSCPLCSTRYIVDPRALGAGRLVRCARCSHTWHQAPPEEAPPRIDVVAPPSEVEPPSPRTEGRVQLPALPQRRHAPWVAIGWIILLLIVGGVAGGGVWARDEVIRLWPPSARLYQLVGLAAPQPGDWYQIRAEPRRDEENGVPRLVIKGEVINSSSVAQEVPKLKVLLRDASNRIVQSWTFSVSDERLLPGASVPFTTSVVRPNEAATGMTVTVAGTGE